METLDITMLIGLVLMVSALVILYRCARGKSRRQRMNELADTLLSIHDSFELQVPVAGDVLFGFIVIIVQSHH